MNALSRIPGLLPLGALTICAIAGFVLTGALMGAVATPAQAQEMVAGGKQDRLKLRQDQTRTPDGQVILVVLPSLFDV